MDEKQIKELIERVDAQKDSEHIHKPYSETWGEEPDFEVEYEFDIDPSLGPINPMQGMRSDFLYEGDDPAVDGIHMIWPEFLDGSGNVITDKRIALPAVGKAIMWIGMNESREEIHKKRIDVGVKGYWVVGSKKLANVRVTKLIGLNRD